MDESGRASEWTLEAGRDIERSYSMGLPHLAALFTIGLASEAALHEHWPYISCLFLADYAGWSQ